MGAAYVIDPVDGSYKLWVATRARTKVYCPGMLDSTAGGGIASDESPFDTICREAFEEASLPIALCRQRIRHAGVISVLHIDEDKLEAAPDVDYCFDLRLEPDEVPRPNDGEAERFDLLSVDALIEALLARRFMPDAALVWIDFLVRHSLVRPDNEPFYAELCCSLRRHATIVGF